VAGAALAAFPVTAGAFAQCYSANAFAAEFSPSGLLEGATYFGPPETYNVGAIAVGASGLVSIAAAVQNGTGAQNDFVANLLIDNPQQPDGPCMSLAVESAASYAPSTVVAPGELLTLPGVGFGPRAGVSWSPQPNGLLPTHLAGVQVFFDKLAAPLMYVQARQINLEVPWEIAGMASNEIQVVYNGVATNTAPVTVQAAVPGVFYLTYGSMQAAISEL
jgi:hypothetical protein